MHFLCKHELKRNHSFQIRTKTAKRRESTIRSTLSIWFRRLSANGKSSKIEPKHSDRTPREPLRRKHILVIVREKTQVFQGNARNNTKHGKQQMQL